jgi:hypothetical protein
MEGQHAGAPMSGTSVGIYRPIHIALYRSHPVQHPKDTLASPHYHVRHSRTTEHYRTPTTHYNIPRTRYNIPRTRSRLRIIMYNIHG